MRKISPKTAWYALISVSIIMVLGMGACMKPVDVESFLEDDMVKDLIESTGGLVRIDTKSDSYKELKAGNGRISGLNKDKYYLIERERDENGGLVTEVLRYVTDYKGPFASLGPGAYINDIVYITRISGGIINGLTNDHIYKIREAGAVTTSFKVSGISDPVTVQNGKITIPGSAGNSSLDNLNDSYLDYEVMAVAVSPTTLPTRTFSTKKTISSTVNSFKLEGEGTTVDYVFVKKITDGTVYFEVLRVEIEPIGEGDKPINIAAIPGVTAPVAGEKPVSTTETVQYTGTVTWDNGNPTAFTAGIEYTATITLTPKTGFTLDGVAANFFTVAGATVSYTASSDTVSAKFPAAPTKINIAAIPGVTAPVAGRIPVSAITETTQYTGIVTWNGNPSTFAVSTAYTATIKLTPKSGYTLAGVAANFFTVAGAIVNYTAGSDTVTAVFPATASTVTGINLVITFVLHDVDIISGGTVTDPITYDKLAGSDTLTFTVDDGHGGVFTSVTWDMDGVYLDSGNTLTLDKDATTFLSKLTTGAHVINVRGTKNGQSFSQNFTLDVNNN